PRSPRSSLDSGCSVGKWAGPVLWIAGRPTPHRPCQPVGSHQGVDISGCPRGRKTFRAAAQALPNVLGVRVIVACEKVIEVIKLRGWVFGDQLPEDFLGVARRLPGGVED